jgi:hypothetical protein
MANKEEIQKSIETLVDAALEKGLNNEAQNGGNDEIKSGSPKTEEMKMSEEAEEKKKKDDMEKAKAKKSEDNDADDKKKEDEKKEMEKAMKKADDDKKDEDKKEDDKDEAEKAKKAKKSMKKSLQDLSSVLDEEELELIKAWRSEQAEEENVVKSEDIAKAVSDITSAQVDELRKSMNAQNDLIKSMSEQIKKLSSQPAHDKRSIDTLETLAKSGTQESATITKSQVLDVMLDLQKSGKGVTSHHVAEFEATGNISNGQIKALVMGETQKRNQ